MFNKFFFPIVDTCLSCEDKVVRWCQNGDFLRPVFAASRVPRAAHFRHEF